MWYEFPVECGELGINHLSLLLVVIMPYACWFLWWAKYIVVFSLGLRLEGFL